ncbi:unnamed protein product [Euphydryas editha]|uniref:Ribosomal protein S13 n=1 Tax=Euphydryas editha TaxID=104508 RepID=A0AAU9U5J0_EUPED|nr:unnamed protein product [Euphydryas editha]
MKTEMFMIAIALKLLPITAILALLHIDRTVIYIEVSSSNRLIVKVLIQIGTYDRLPNREVFYEFRISQHMFFAISYLKIALNRLGFNQMLALKIAVSGRVTKGARRPINRRGRKLRVKDEVPA